MLIEYTNWELQKEIKPVGQVRSDNRPIERSKTILNHPSKLFNPNHQTYIPVNAFLPRPDEPAGITLRTLNLTVFDKGLQSDSDH